MVDERFRPHERLKSPAAFRRAYDRRRVVSDEHLVVHAVENDLTYSRLGISVPRRRIRKAVDRNRFKRLVRESFRLSKAMIPAGMDLVVSPRGGVPSYAQVRTSLERLAGDAARRLRLNLTRAPEPERSESPAASDGPGRDSMTEVGL